MKLQRPSSRHISIAVAAAVLVAAVAFIAVRSGPLARTRVTLTQPVEGALAPTLFGIGTVEAQRAWLIGPTGAGRVLRVLVDAGQSVKAGQLLAEMDPVDLPERVAALQASQQRAISAIAAAQAQTEDAQARRALAAMNEKRYAELQQKGFISPSAAESKAQELASADAALNASQASLAGSRQDLIRIQAETAALAQQRASVRLLAPADAVVVSRDAEPGSTVVAGQAVLRLADPSSLWVKLRLDQGRSAGLTNGLPARITLRSRPAQPLPGHVARVEMQADSVTEERLAQIAFDTPPPGLVMGELAEVTLTLPATARTLLLPNAAIHRRGGQTGVWRLTDGEPRFVPLQLGQSSPDGAVQVLNGVQAGDKVVLHSEKALSPGQRIQIVDSLTGKQP